jgi:hypothetical protein
MRFTLNRHGVADPGDWREFSSSMWMPFTGPNLFAGLLFSSIGFVGFIYGKRMSAWKPMFLGIALMAYSYFIEDTITICAVGLAGSAALFWFRN